MRHGAVCDVASAWYYGCLMSSGHPRFCGLCLCDVALDAIQYGTVRVSCGNYRPIYRGWVSSRAKQCNLVELLVYSLSDRGITVNLIGPLATRRTIGTRTDGLRKAPAGLPRPSPSRVSLDGTSADLRLRLQSSAKLGEWYHAPCAMILTQTAALLSGCPRNLLSLPCA